jgi:hypothetical protein
MFGGTNSPGDDLETLLDYADLVNGVYLRTTYMASYRQDTSVRHGGFCAHGLTESRRMTQPAVRVIGCGIKGLCRLSSWLARLLYTL